MSSEGENIKKETESGGGRKWQKGRGGTKGKISPCNDHGGEPQKPTYLAKKKKKKHSKIK